MGAEGVWLLDGTVEGASAASAGTEGHLDGQFLKDDG